MAFFASFALGSLTVIGLGLKARNAALLSGELVVTMTRRPDTDPPTELAAPMRSEETESGRLSSAALGQAGRSRRGRRQLGPIH
jgi:hypothetical protein